ncbi:MAG: PD-(D/E)XK nuclease family protein [Solirubrobacteraceae bacterium]
MSCKLVLGPANSAKAGEVLGAYKAVAPRGALLVVPTAVDARHYQRELAADGVVLGGVLTFSGLAREIALRAGYAGSRLSDLQRERVLATLLGALRFESIGASADSPGFRSAAGELIAELERELITPQRFVAALRASSAQDPRNAPYARDLGAIYSHYGRELERLGRVDRELYAWQALDALRAQPGSWGRDEVFFYGFDELTALERDAVETLSRIVGVDVTVSLTYEPGRAAMLARAGAAAELTQLADQVLELPALDQHYTAESRAGLHHLERCLFEPDCERIDPGPAVALLEAGGARAEAELVAGHVVSLLRAGVRGGEIAVVYRSARQVAPLVSRVFAQYGIALNAGRELPLPHTPLGRALRGAARCALLDERQARAADLLDYLRAPGLLDHQEVADRLEARLLREGRDSVAAARQILGWRLSELDELSGSSHPGAQLCALARRLFAAPHRHTAPVLSDAEELDARALATLMRALQEIAELGQQPSGEELVALLDELTVDATVVGSDDQVVLAEPLEIRARRFRAVFVCGLQESEFPLPARPDPFLSDELRRELAACSGLRLRQRDDALDRERYLFYTTTSRATERVVLSYRSCDEEGNLALRSPFVADVAELFDGGWSDRRARRLLADVVWDPAQAPTELELARSISAARAPAAGERAAAERALSEVSLARLRHTEILSAGALESYADCPIKWLVERELRPEPLEPEAEAIARGNIMHTALERVLSELGEPLTPGSLQAAREILQRVLAADGASRLGVGRPAVVREAALRAIEADLRRYLAHEARAGAGLRVAALEQQFGFDEPGSLAALELGDGADRVLVRGAIDRIDVDAQGRAIVRDYKSGTSRAVWPAARWSADRQLQVALYLLVVRQLTPYEPAAGFYQPLRGDDLRGRGMYLDGTSFGAVNSDARGSEEFDDQLTDASERAVALAVALRSGALTPCPQTCTRDGCAYPGICRSQ